MRALLFILSVVAALLGGATLVYATTVTHEILSGVFFVIASILLIGAAIVDALIQLPERMKKSQLPIVMSSDPPREPEVNAAAFDMFSQSGKFRRPP